MVATFLMMALIEQLCVHFQAVQSVQKVVGTVHAPAPVSLHSILPTRVDTLALLP